MVGCQMALPNINRTNICWVAYQPGDSEMHDHDWIVEVCEDLKKYAKKHHLNHLMPGLDDALIAAKHDVLLRSSMSRNEPIRNCAILGSTFGLFAHSKRDLDEPRESFSARRQ